MSLDSPVGRILAALQAWRSAPENRNSKNLTAWSTLPPSPTPAPYDDGHNLDSRVKEAWQSWLLRFTAFVADPGSFALAAEYRDVLLAALQISPGNLLRSDLLRMTRSEWNALALRGLPATGATDLRSWEDGWVAPGWALGVALHQLGFYGITPWNLGWNVEPTSDQRPLLEAMQAKTVDRPGLLIVEATPNLIDPTADYRQFPLLTVPVDALPRLSASLGAMCTVNTFIGAILEVTPSSAPPTLGSGFRNLSTLIVSRLDNGDPFKPDQIDALFSQWRSANATPTT